MSTAENPVSMDIRDGIAVLTLDSPPVNALGHAVRSGLMNALEKAEGDEGVEAVVIRGGGRCFSGGADIREFGQPPAEPTMSKPVWPRSVRARAARHAANLEASPHVI